MSSTTPNRTVPVCSECRSTRLTVDGPYVWSISRQEWVGEGSPYDNTYCEDCEGETRDVQSDLIFVFGSNRAGIHGAGAARKAREKWGAITGIGEGHVGKSYALPTKDMSVRTLPLDEIKKHVETFLEYARNNMELTFMVTAVGCGLAGYAREQIAPMFKDAPANCLFDTEWAVLLGASHNYWGTYR